MANKKYQKGKWIYWIYVCLFCFAFLKPVDLEAVDDGSPGADGCLHRLQNSERVVFSLEGNNIYSILLLSNSSPGLAGACVEYSVVSSVNTAPPLVSRLDAGDPAPKVIIKQWGGDKMTVCNIAKSSSALLDVRLYAVYTNPAVPISVGPREYPLTRYGTAGTRLASDCQYLEIGAPFELSVFIVLIGSEVMTYWVNNPEDSSSEGIIKTKQNLCSVLIVDKQGEQLLVINASPTHTGRSYVKLLNLAASGSSEFSDTTASCRQSVSVFAGSNRDISVFYLRSS